jgi:hypothetical protein
MPIWGWICLGALLVSVAFLAWAIVNSRIEERRCREEGKRVLGWIVQANSDLYSTGSIDRPAQILVCFDARDNPPDPFMEDLARRAGVLKRKESQSAEEDEVAALVKDESYRPFQRFLLPRKFTQGKLVYSMHVWVKRKHLPAGKLKYAFVRCYALEDDEKSRSLMAPYEASDRDFRIPVDDIGPR